MPFSLEQPDQPVEADFSVLYSGGLDSTAVAVMMGYRFAGRIHLCTADHDFGNLFVHWSKKHVVDLRRIHGDERVLHEILNISDTFRATVFGRFWEDMREYGHVVWCLGCSMSMVAHATAYNLIHGVPLLFICSSVAGEYSAVSHPVSIRMIGELCEEFGVEYRAPLLELKVEKPEERRILEEHGMWLGVRFRRGGHGVQPICVPGFQHILDVTLDVHTTYDEDKMADYIRTRSDRFRSAVRAITTAAAVDPDARVEQLRAVRARLSGPGSH